ncbi:hypothetical protein [Halomonas sp. MES3-P3E]|uniref:hypothetical protein n=1 Tax=Halomonas sp. MES3-P3E TaxID=2058321 RepID=UPI0018E393FD|nr:hypothetical protein [Halomonas sp. MES3-P3E]
MQQNDTSGEGADGAPVTSITESIGVTNASTDITGLTGVDVTPAGTSVATTGFFGATAGDVELFAREDVANGYAVDVTVAPRLTCKLPRLLYPTLKIRVLATVLRI